MGFKEIGQEGVDWIYDPVAGSCKHDNESSGTIKVE
jgi:hypothetical protein